MVLAAFLAVVAANASTTVQETRAKTSRGEALIVLSAAGMRQVMIALTPQFEQETGHTLAVTFDSGAVIARNVLAGGTADIVVIPGAAIDDLVRAAAIVPGSVIDIASSVTGLAVRRGLPKPDISSPESSGERCWLRNRSRGPIQHREAQVDSTSNRCSTVSASPSNYGRRPSWQVIRIENRRCPGPS